jgi:hypothetical protein
MGTAISTGLATATVNVMRLLQVHLLLHVQPYRKETLKPLGAGLISSLVTGEMLYLLSLTKWTLHIGHIHIPVEISLIPVFLTLYIWILRLFGATPEDLHVLQRLKKKLKISNIDLRTTDQPSWQVITKRRHERLYRLTTTREAMNKRKGRYR